MIRIITILILLFASPAFSQAMQRLSVIEGTGKVVRLSEPAANIFVGDPETITVQSVNASTLFISGVTPGVTNLIILDERDTLLANYRVSVRADLGEAGAALQDAAPENIRLDQAGNTIIIKGQAKTYEEALAVLDAERALKDEGRRVINRAQLSQPNQVALRVRFVEVSRTDLKRVGLETGIVRTAGDAVSRLLTGSGIATSVIDDVLGIGDNSIRASARTTVGDVDVDVLIDALERRGVVQILSEPTLTTISGQRADFHAGGEFAFPVNQGDGVITAEYKQTGVSLSFLPTILPKNRILIEVEPEVSFVDEGQSRVNIEGFVAPAISVRRAKTKVEVTSGQTFAIAGLYEQTFSDNSNNVPGLSGLGNRSKSTTERELIIFITPYLSDARQASTTSNKSNVSIIDRVGFILK